MRASSVTTTKKKKTKNPWRELQKANIHWRAKAALRLVFTPTAVNSERIHASPSKLMIPERDKINLQASFGGRSSLFLVVIRFWRAKVCSTATTTTLPKIHMLKRIMSRIGPRNAPKKMPMWLMKQLKKGRKKNKRDKVTESVHRKNSRSTHYPGAPVMLFGWVM